MSRRAWWAWARVLAGVAILAVLVWRLGTGPFLDGIRTVDASALVAASAIAVVTTVGCAWRWSIVARGLGVAVPLRAAVGAYYRSQFLNSVLPGGVLGDVHRAVSHGRDVGDVGRGLRAVAWERAAGQVVQILLAFGVLLALPSPARPAMPYVAAAVLAVVVILAVVRGGTSPAGPPASRWARLRGTAGSDVRDGLLARRAWPGIALASTVVVAGHAATFLIAARTAGVAAPPARLLPLALLVLLAMGVPANIGGWGPREGVAAWAFGVAGLGVDRGVATAVVYGVMSLVATLPGAVVLIVAAVRGTAAGRGGAPAEREPVAVAAGRAGRG